MIPRYSSPEISEIWSDSRKYQRWMEVEMAALMAMEAAGKVPRGAYNKIDLKRTRVKVDRILKIEEETRHDVVAFLRYLEEEFGDDAKWLHLGLTSSDIVDTAFSKALREACMTVASKAALLVSSLKRKAQDYAETPMIGRTHGMWAEVTTFGAALCSHMCEINRSMHQLISASENLVGKLSGAVGSYANADEWVENVALGELRLRAETAPTQVVARDRYASVFCALAILAASVERLALNIRHWSRSEVGEVAEPFRSGQKGSSAMPHKQNPISCENLCGLSRIVRSAVIPAIENIPLWHERDISHSSVERIIAPDATGVMAYMLDMAKEIVAGMQVNVEAMAKNIQACNGRHASEALMLALIKNKGVSRSAAHAMIQDLASKQNFFDSVVESGLFSQQEISDCFSISKAVNGARSVVARSIKSI